MRCLLEPVKRKKITLGVRVVDLPYVHATPEDYQMCLEIIRKVREVSQGREKC